MGERRDFKQYQIDLVYDLQEGCCPLCGAGLEQTGFHRHHKNSDHADNSVSNLTLLCPRCHHSKAGLSNPYIDHQKQEMMVLEKANSIIEQILNPQTVEIVDAKGNTQTKVLELSGVVLDKLTDMLSLSLRVSRNATDVDYGREFTPASIKLQRSMADQDARLQSFMDGVMYGVKKALEVKME